MTPESVLGQVHAADALKVALVLGLLTLTLRIGGAEIKRRISGSRGLDSILEWLPVAALAAMVAPTFAPQAGSGLEASTLVAAAVTAFVGYRTRNFLLSVGAGLLVYGLLG